jgi:hypothetical protein
LRSIRIFISKFTVSTFTVFTSGTYHTLFSFLLLSSSSSFSSLVSAVLLLSPRWFCFIVILAFEARSKTLSTKTKKRIKYLQENLHIPRMSLLCEIYFLLKKHTKYLPHQVKTLKILGLTYGKTFGQNPQKTFKKSEYSKVKTLTRPMKNFRKKIDCARV